MIKIENSEKKCTHMSSRTVYIKTGRKKRLLVKEKLLRLFNTAYLSIPVLVYIYDSLLLLRKSRMPLSVFYKEV